MKFLGLNRVSFMRLLWSCKTTKINNFFLKGYLRLVWFDPKPRLKADSLKAIFIGMRTISSILTVCCLSKVFNSIVSFVSINMVYLFNGPILCFIKPSKSMGSIMLPVNFYIDISSMVDTTGFHPNFYFGPWGFPVKNTSAFLVRKNAY